ncbi:MAG: gfo/Idh/MocA family oxidoreductase [Betaproteobacteria bacterium]|nr:MAG: gfo/Idh/MocA family oxidoreductase [Betaproteobacteria bacterium]
MDKPSFGWAVIGPGRIANRFAEAVCALPGMHLQHVQGRDRDRADAFARRWTRTSDAPIATTTELAEVLANDAVHGVYIATPHAFHCDAIRAAILARKPVVCEKPMVTDARAAAELFALSGSQRTFLMEAVWTRFLPLHHAVAEWLRAGLIGEVRSLQSSFCFNAPFDPKSRLFDPAQAGGALLDIGIYNLTVTRMVLAAALGRCPTALRIDASALLAPTGVDQRLHATLYFPGGIASQFVCAIDSAADNSFHIFGEHGTITIHNGFWQATRATLKRTGQAPLEIKHPFRTNGFEYQIEAAVAAIRDGRIECDRIPHAETLETLRWMDQIRSLIGVRYPFDSPQ